MSNDEEGRTTEQEAAPSGFDLGAIDTVIQEQEQGYTVHLEDHKGNLLYFEDGDGQQRPVTWTVAGEHSKLYRTQERMVRDRYFKRRGRGTVDAEDLEDQTLDLLARVSLGWSGIFEGGRPIPFDRDKAKEILRKATWVRRQVSAASGDHEGLFRPSSPS